MGKEITKTEQRVLDTLRSKVNDVCSYSDLIPDYDKLDDESKVQARRSMNVHICNLKKKIGSLETIDSLTNKGYYYKNLTNEQE